MCMCEREIKELQPKRCIAKEKNKFEWWVNIDKESY